MQRRRERTKRMMIDSSEITNARDRAREFWTPLFLPPPPPSPLLESCASLLLHSSSSWSPRDRLGRETLCKSSPSIHQPAALASFANLVVGGLPSISLSLLLLLFPSPPARLVVLLLHFTLLRTSLWPRWPTSRLPDGKCSQPLWLDPVPCLSSFLFFISFYIPPSLFNQYRGPVSPNLYLLLLPSPLLVSYYFFSLIFSPRIFPFEPLSLSLSLVLPSTLPHSLPRRERVNFCERAASLFGLGKGSRRDREFRFAH